MKPSDRSLLWILPRGGPLCSACRQTLCASKRDLGIAVPPRVAGTSFLSSKKENFPPFNIKITWLHFALHCFDQSNKKKKRGDNPAEYLEETLPPSLMIVAHIMSVNNSDRAMSQYECISTPSLVYLIALQLTIYALHIAQLNQDGTARTHKKLTKKKTRVVSW